MSLSDFLIKLAATYGSLAMFIMALIAILHCCGGGEK